jgi:hypothetical protein
VRVAEHRDRLTRTCRFLQAVHATVARLALVRRAGGRYLRPHRSRSTGMRSPPIGSAEGDDELLPDGLLLGCETVSVSGARRSGGAPGHGGGEGALTADARR